METTDKTQQLREQLSKASKEELIENLIKLAEEKKEIQKDLQLVGKSLVGILKTLGVMNDNYEIVQDVTTIIKAAGGFINKAIFMPSIMKEKFAFLMDAAPLLEKYKDLLKK